MRIRTFRREDQASAHSLIQAGLRERWAEGFDPSANPDTADVWLRYMTGGRQFVVAEADDRSVVGTGALVPEEQGVSRIVRVSVHQQHRRLGIGKAIVAELVERARQKGDERVVVLTDTPWTEAIALYEAAGFETVGVDLTDTHFSLNIRA